MDQRRSGDRKEAEQFFDPLGGPQERGSSKSEADSFMTPATARNVARSGAEVTKTNPKDEADSFMSPVVDKSGIKVTTSEAHKRAPATEADSWMTPVVEQGKDSSKQNLTQSIAKSGAKVESHHRTDETILKDKDFGNSLAAAFSKKPPRPGQAKQDEGQENDLKDRVVHEAAEKGAAYQKDHSQLHHVEVDEKEGKVHKEKIKGVGQKIQEFLTNPVGIGAVLAVAGLWLVRARSGKNKRVNRKVTVRRVEIYPNV